MPTFLDALEISRKVCVERSLIWIWQRGGIGQAWYRGVAPGRSPAPWTEFSGSMIAGGGRFVIVIVWKHVSVMLLTYSNWFRNPWSTHFLLYLKFMYAWPWKSLSGPHLFTLFLMCVYNIGLREWKRGQKSRSGQEREGRKTRQFLRLSSCEILNQPSVPSSVACIQLATAGREPYTVEMMGASPFSAVWPRQLLLPSAPTTLIH